MGKRGGRRKGAGRKKGGKNKSTILKDDVKAHAVEMIKYHVEDLIMAKLDLALGEYYYEQTDVVGKVKVYKAKPNGSDINDLLHYAIGKPTQPVDLDVSGRIEHLHGLAQNIRSILGGGLKDEANGDATASPQLIQG